MRQQLQGQHQCKDCIGSKGRRSHSSVVQNSIKLAADISRILPSTQIYAQVMSNGIDDDQNFLCWVCTWYKTEDEYIKPSYDDESLEPYHPTYLPEEWSRHLYNAWYTIDERIKPSTEYIKTLSSENRVLLIETVLAKEQEAEREYT